MSCGRDWPAELVGPCSKEPAQSSSSPPTGLERASGSVYIGKREVISQYTGLYFVVVVRGLSGSAWSSGVALGKREWAPGCRAA